MLTIKNSLKALALLSSAAALLTAAGCGNVVSKASGDPQNNPAESSSETNTPGTDETNADPTASISESASKEAPSDIGSDTITSISLTFNEVTLSIGESKMPIVTMLPEDSSNKEEIWTSSDEKIAVVDKLGNITAVSEGTCTVTVTSENNPSVSSEVKVTVKANSHTSSGASARDLTYIKGILIANKTYALPSDYNPGLDPTTKNYFEKLSIAAAEEGLDIYLSSGFRSYEYQSQIYNNYSNIYGSETADTFSARPGHSEHQTGLAIDVNTIDDSFAGTPEAIWLAEHAHEFGFIIRYPADKVDITGYKYEPWHIRYLGVELATDVYNSGLCLEEYLGIDSKYNY